MSIADSALLRATLTLSRHSWTHTAFTRFTPEPAAKGSGGKKYASEITPLGQCTVCIGPHIFLETKFFTVFNPPPPLPFQPPPISNSSSDATTPTEASLHSSSPTPATVTASPTPERAIDLSTVKPTNTTTEVEAVASTPVDSAQPVVSQQSSLNDPVQECLTDAIINNEGLQSKPNAETLENSESNPVVSTPSSGSKIKTSASRPQKPRHQVTFEFKETPGVRWLFPHESSLEFLPADGGNSARIAASFYLPTAEESRIGIAGTGTSTSPGASQGMAQATTLVILQATTELWASLQQCVSDPAATYRFMMEMMKHIPPRIYVQYNLPLDTPDEQLKSIDLKHTPESPKAPPKAQDSSKRRPETLTEQTTAVKVKRPKATHDEKTALGSKGNTQAKKSSSSSNTISALSHQRQCAYCGCTSTPTWRRGPDGPHTLCNACGVKWRQGRIFIDTLPATPPPVEVPIVPVSIPTAASPLPIPGPDTLTTTAEAATRMCVNLLKSGSVESGNTGDGMLSLNETTTEFNRLHRRDSRISKRQDHPASASASNTDDMNIERTSDVDKAPAGKKKGAHKAGPKLVPIHQIGETSKVPGKTGSNLKRGREKSKSKDKLKDKEKEKEKDADMGKNKEINIDMDTDSNPAHPTLSRSTKDTSPLNTSADLTPTTPTLSSPESGSKTPITVSGKTSELAPAISKPIPTKISTTASKGLSRQKSSVTATATSVIAKSTPPNVSAVSANLSILKSLTGTPRYQSDHVSGVSLISQGDDGLSLYATKNLYTNNTATFPLHFPTISIAFGPNNAYYMYPNCAVVLFENHFQIKLIHAGERTDIDIWKEGIEGTEFQVVDVGDGESMIVMKAQLNQYLSRFQKDLLNPDKNETSIVFRFRERLDGGGPPVKPLLEQWLTTEIPVAGSPEKKV
ncbi:hypothetical protein BGZ46_004734 [Entomortierella lignicola]|nr:hypothetical protein BGZ46_004734 [Entomortierella lignicola]